MKIQLRPNILKLKMQRKSDKYAIGPMRKVEETQAVSSLQGCQSGGTKVYAASKAILEVLGRREV